MRHTYKLYKVMKSIGGNSGYVGYSMSKRALRARNEGAYPKTDFKKEYSVAASHFGYLLEAGIIYVSEWHHTSKFGNRIDFYRWDEDEYIAIYEQSKKNISLIVKSVGKAPRMEDYPIDKMRDFIEADRIYQDSKNEAIDKIKSMFYENFENN